MSMTVNTNKEQQSFLNYFQDEFWNTRTSDILSRIEQVVPWNTLEKKVWQGRKIAPGWVWRPRTEVILLLKILFLQWMYSLSDPEAEDQIKDRNSFQKFLWIREVKDIPDETVICRFRNELVLGWIQESVFTITQSMLYEMGYSVKQWHIQDWTIIEAPKGRKKPDWTSTRDKEATFTKKNWRNYHWYKWHIETASKWPFILNTTYTTASVHDSQELDSLMMGEEVVAYWDSAYWMSKDKNETLKSYWVETDFHEKWKRWNPLSPFQKQCNRAKSSIRARVEHPFSTIKHRFKFRNVRYRWLIKNWMHWFLQCAICNFELMARRFT